MTKETKDMLLANGTWMAIGLAITWRNFCL